MFWVCMVLLSPSYVSLRLVIYLRRPRTWNIVKFQNKQEENRATEFLVSTDCRYKEKRLLVFLMWRLLLLCQKIDWCQYCCRTKHAADWMSTPLQNKARWWLDVYRCIHCCRTKHAGDWMFTDDCNAAEQSMLLTGCSLMSAMLQNKICCWLDVYWWL
jgi:hypothetical protein